MWAIAPSVTSLVNQIVRQAEDQQFDDDTGPLMGRSPLARAFMPGGRPELNFRASKCAPSVGLCTIVYASVVLLTFKVPDLRNA
jgi:hypothetical protein